MTLPAPLIARIDGATARYGRGRPIPAAEARAKFDSLGVVPDDDYLEFIGRWGGCFVGVSVHAWDQSSLLGTTTASELTARARTDFGDVVDGVVFADDGAGNPIWVTAGGPVQLVDHNSGFEVVHVADSFERCSRRTSTTDADRPGDRNQPAVSRRRGAAEAQESVPPSAARRRELSTSINVSSPRRSSATLSLTPVSSAAFASRSSSIVTVVLIEHLRAHL